MADKLVEAMVHMREKEALDIARYRAEGGEDPLEILNACTLAMEAVGKRFEQGQYFLPELILAGEMLTQISEMLKPKIKGAVISRKQGKVLMGTVEGDIHNIGKDIVSFLLDVNGFEVRDIGIDVAPAIFVKEIKEFQPQVVGLSGLLTLAYEAMRDTVKAMDAAGLRGSVKVMIGGGQMSEQVRQYTGADAFGKDAMEGVGLVKKWLATGGVKHEYS